MQFTDTFIDNLQPIFLIVHEEKIITLSSQHAFFNVYCKDNFRFVKRK